MRPLVHGDVTTAARVLLAAPSACRRALDDRGYLSCLAVVIDALLAERTHPGPDAVSQADRVDVA